MLQSTGEMEVKKAPLPAPALRKDYTLPRAQRRSLDRHYSRCPPLSKDDYSEKDPTSEMEKKKKAPLPTAPFYKERPLPRSERSPDRRYSPYPPPSMDGCSGKNAGSWPLSPVCYVPPSDALHVDWVIKDGVLDIEQYSKDVFAAMDKHSFWSMFTCTHPQFGANVSAEYVLDPIFKDTELVNPRFSYLLPLIGHKVASAAEAPNSTRQDAAVYRRDGGEESASAAPALHKDYTLPRAQRRSPDPLSKDDYYSEKDPTSEMEKKKKAPLPTAPFYKERPLPRAERSPDRRYSPYPPPSMDGCSGKNAGSWPLSPVCYVPPSDALHVDWVIKDGVLDIEQYSTDVFAAMDKHSFWSMFTCTHPQFGPNVSAEYVLDPIFKDTELVNPRFSYLLPLIGHKVASAAEAPNSTRQVGTTTGYWQRDGSTEVPVREVAALKISEN